MRSGDLTLAAIHEEVDRGKNGLRRRFAVSCGDEAVARLEQNIVAAVLREPKRTTVGEKDITTVAVVIGRSYGIDEFQLGLLMVMATQIGSTTPPVAVLLFVATSIAGCKYNETIRYCWAFILAEIAVLIMVVFWPALAAFIPHHFLG